MSDEITEWEKGKSDWELERELRIEESRTRIQALKLEIKKTEQHIRDVDRGMQLRDEREKKQKEKDDRYEEHLNKAESRWKYDDEHDRLVLAACEDQRAHLKRMADAMEKVAILLSERDSG